jgi:hypothetical protein
MIAARPFRLQGSRIHEAQKEASSLKRVLSLLGHKSTAIEKEIPMATAVITPFPASSRHRKAVLAPELPPGRDERHAAGKALRQRVPREQHAEWKPARHRRDPVELVIESSKRRIPELIPIRYGRMMVSPFESVECS